ncbi:MAG TPA: Gfo/Idh/MocA family oxidoreductase [Candidatus Hydrogenedentes bacterium]|nr:Gfo/Idh/MocA family oxidoreductase [Candidatus Hydrogenedentota bacterium]
MLVANGDNIRLAMVGMVAENGHPYSWSAIINGEYNKEAMAQCGYPAIPEYLGAQPPEALGIDGARVTHVWCEDRAEAEHVAKASCIEHVVDHPEDVIGKVDAVIIPTDIGGEHVERARPFIEAGLPLFIDKPLTDNIDDLVQFIDWHDAGKPFLSTSALRYASEYHELRDKMDEIGEARIINVVMAKSWERYGIHALEAVYAFLRAGGYLSVTHAGDPDVNVMTVEHEDGAHLILKMFYDLKEGFGRVVVQGTEGTLSTDFDDTFGAFKRQLETFIEYLRTGMEPFNFNETIEQMKIIIAGIKSREQGERCVLPETKKDNI